MKTIKARPWSADAIPTTSDSPYELLIKNKIEVQIS